MPRTGGDGDELRHRRLARLIEQHSVEHRQILLEIATRYCSRDRTAANDLVQDTYVRALDKLDTLHDESRMLGWLVAILRNCWLDACRRRCPDVAIGELPDRPLESDEPLPWQRLTVDDFRAAIQQLAEPFRSAVILHDLDRRSLAEIAAATGAPYATVATRIHRAHKQLGQLLRAQLAAGEDRS